MENTLESPTNLRIVLVTAPSAEKASEIGRTLLEARLCACINIIPALRSLYWWEGKIQDDSEVLLIIKTVEERVSELSVKLKQCHPYETPEFVVLTPESALTPYAEWARKAAR